MEIKDKHIEDLLFNHFAGRLNEDEQKELLQWLEADPAHKQTLSQMADWWATAHVPLFMSDLKSDFTEHFGHLTEKKNNSAKQPAAKWLFWRNIAASAIILISVSVVSFYAGRISKDFPEITDATGESFNAISEIVTPMGATSKVILPDGSIVWINAGSTLSYDYNYNRSKREVLLIGEAYFEVMSDPLKPFIVKSDELDIQVVGTSFNVKAYQDDDAVDVSLITGSINVHMNNPGLKSEEVTLSPDRMLSFNKEANSMEIVEIKGIDAMAWTTGRIKFADMPFSKLAKDLERKFSVRILIQSERLKKECFSGSFSPDHTLDQILREVDMEKKYRWTQQRDEVIIRDK